MTTEVQIENERTVRLGIIHKLLNDAVNTTNEDDSQQSIENVANFETTIRQAHHSSLISVFKTFIYFLKHFQPNPKFTKVYKMLFKMFIENLLVSNRNLPGQILKNVHLHLNEFRNVLDTFYPLENHDEHVQIFFLEIYYHWLQLHSLLVHYRNIDTEQTEWVLLLTSNSPKVQEIILKILWQRNQLDNYLDKLNKYFKYLIADNMDFILTRSFLQNYFEKLSRDNQEALIEYFYNLNSCSYYIFLDTCLEFHAMYRQKIINNIHYAIVNDANFPNEIYKKTLIVKCYNYFFVNQLKSEMNLLKIFSKSLKRFEISNEQVLENYLNQLKQFIIYESNHEALENIFGYLLSIYLSTKSNLIFVILLDFLKYHPQNLKLLTNWSNIEIYLQSIIKDESHFDLLKAFTNLILEDSGKWSKYEPFFQNLLQEQICQSTNGFIKLFLSLYDADDKGIVRSESFNNLLKRNFIDLINNTIHVNMVTISVLGTLLKSDDVPIPQSEFRKYFDFLKSSLNTTADVHTCLKFLVLFIQHYPKSDYRNEILTLLKIIINSENFTNFILLKYAFENLTFEDRQILLRQQMKCNNVTLNFKFFNAIVGCFADNDNDHEILNQILIYIISKSDLYVNLEFVDLVLNNSRLVLKTHEIDNITHILSEVIKAPDRIEYMKRCLKLLNTLFYRNFDLLTDKLPIITLLIRLSLKTLHIVIKNSTNSVTFVENGARELEKLTDRFVHFQRHFVRIAAYLIADFLNFYVLFSNWSDVKLYLGNSIKNLLKTCDEPAMKFIRKSLKENRTVILDNFVRELNKTKFSGKV